MLLPEPWVCQTTPPRRSPSGPAASTVDSTAALTAQYWWYFATRLTSPCGSSLKTMKFLHEVEEPALVEDALDEHLERRPVGDDLAAVDRLPRRVVLEAAGERAHRRADVPSEITVTALGVKTAGMSVR